ncbi:DUF488 family protein [Pseudomonas sp. Sample_10]|uniref:DUF488 domain-containing protein n=1 Tax=Pseudomonas sp. Sample_10 TaxID=2448269 RepID=UPI0010366182|nr:DUF488 family protein [Pseudomonas sp. Sample_10]
MIQCKRAGEPARGEDGRRILVDREWPRHCSRDSLPLDQWLPDVAPSIDLHKAFTAGEVDFGQFSAAYRQQLIARPEHWWVLLGYAQTGTLTLVFAAQNLLENHAVVLARWLEDELDRYQEASSPVCYRDEFPGY